MKHRKIIRQSKEAKIESAFKVKVLFELTIER